MADAVPMDDLPDNLVPSSDLPGQPAAAPVNPYSSAMEGMSPLELEMAGAGGALKGAGIQLRKLFGRDVSPQEVEDYRQSMEALRQSKWAQGGELWTKAFGAGLAAPLIPVVEGAGIPAMAANTAIESAANAGLAGGMTALDPTADNREIMTNSLIAGAIPAGIGGINIAGQFTKNSILPLFSKEFANLRGGSMLNTAAGEDAGNVVSALQSAQPIISQPSASVAALPARSPGFAALQDIAGKAYPQVAAEDAAKAARAAQIESFAGTPETLRSAISSRTAEASKNYGEALATKYKMDADLKAMIDTPYVQEAIPDVRKIVAARNAVGDNVPMAEQLQMVKKQLDARIAGSPLSKPSTDEDRALVALRDKLNDWMENKLPGYEAANQAYADASNKIFQQRVGQNALGTLQAPIGDAERAGMLSNAVGNEQNLVRKSGGLMSGSLEDQLTPANYTKLQNVIDELSNQASAQQLASKGAQSEAVKSAVGNSVELPHVMNSAVSVVNNLSRRLFGASKRAGLEAISDLASDPQMTAMYMANASQSEKNALKYLIASQRLGIVATPAGVSNK